MQQIRVWTAPERTWPQRIVRRLRSCTSYCLFRTLVVDLPSSKSTLLPSPSSVQEFRGKQAQLVGQRAKSKIDFAISGRPPEGRREGRPRGEWRGETADRPAHPSARDHPEAGRRALMAVLGGHVAAGGESSDDDGGGEQQLIREFHECTRRATAAAAAAAGGACSPARSPRRRPPPPFLAAAAAGGGAGSPHANPATRLSAPASTHATLALKVASQVREDV
jgi:hypothetical protein